MRRTNAGNRDGHYYGLTKLFTRRLQSLFVSLGLSLASLTLIRLQPLQEPFACGDDPMSLRVVLEKARVSLDLAFHPRDVCISFRARHLVLRKLRTLALRQERLCDLPPVAVHHVRLIELDFEKD